MPQQQMMVKIEVDATKENQVLHGTEFVRRHKCPALVVSPDLVRSATVARAMARGSHKIICAVDWPKGTQFNRDKFRGMASEAVHADGFEVLLTPGSKLNITREVKFLSNFFRDHFDQTIEFRLVLGWYAQNRDDEQIKHMVEAVRQIPTPTMIRTTHLTKIPAARATVEAQQEIVDEIVGIRRMPVKLSGNMNSKLRHGVGGVLRYGCTLQQATDLHKDLSNGVIEGIEEAVETTTKSST